MKSLNEFIAKAANTEDNCTGKYWEGRYKSQALLDETALLSCMAYVDLNPIRSNVTNTREDRDFTSIQECLIHLKDTKKSSLNRVKSHTKQLKSLKSFGAKELGNTIPFSLLDYFELIDSC
ncbi:hypothetical protein [Pseudoalteromonas luteoviolacea]|uniref:Transposase n=1 Tax=Pseudoalteromonas luteoviolacea S4054 TaxID=1129367 RepID=A0A0F6AF22_9GAMM|nr:hypothetical protein [Pseudoalteromonas luteoviolacea]AOT08403.1 hypothetical protein S4054249_11345 [Pseudoalteromonas luteoviolacea]AOT13319.1 hypothetical protein S40542_11320 [Pseudoalteromonas luteoviolacea]AOT18232.1 hypothetical protein S4054_11320 [Pseudoalteromonas luteoviolacea]KKE84783.1 hypothetical protein N479_00930 [Pseudoalteromonas luteoviolacea S4054]KZN76042.1 hypothetical protein N481_06745 [Pseudoalteromonas luteoviolacea S4047-1]